ncbi:MAG: hypothetical protein AAGF11_49760 [Myxococcota bacterium]
MRLPATLLGRVRVGIGIGAVVLGGCDLVDEAESAVQEPAPAPTETIASASSPAEPPAKPLTPLLLDRPGVAGVVEQTIERARAQPAPQPPPIADLGRPVEPEPDPAFIPYEGGTPAVSAPPVFTTRPPVRRRPRSRPKASPPSVDPGLAVTSPDRGWECLACGRG